MRRFSAPDVGDDNRTYFPMLGAEADAAELIRTRQIGKATCRLMRSVPFVDFAKVRLDALLIEATLAWSAQPPSA